MAAFTKLWQNLKRVFSLTKGCSVPKRSEAAVVAFTQAASGGGKNLSLFWQNLRMVFSYVAQAGGLVRKLTRDSSQSTISERWQKLHQIFDDLDKSKEEMFGDVIDRDG